MDAPKKQYSGEIPCNLLVLVLCTRRYILQKIPGKLGDIIWGTTHYTVGSGKTVGTDDYNSFYYYYYCCSYFYGVSHANETEILRVHIYSRVFFIFFLRATDTRDGRGKGPVVGLSGNGLTNEYFSCPSRTDDAVTPLCCSEKY